MLGVSALLFTAALIVLAVMLWRSPVRLARSVTLPLEERLRELTDVVRTNATSLAQRLADHDQRLSDHDRRISRLEAGPVAGARGPTSLGSASPQIAAAANP